jgi:hypothetical protein
MKRKLFLVAILVGVCVSGIAGRRAEASFPVCAHAYCTANPLATCTCPPGTKIAGRPATCDSFGPDCNLL